MAITRRHFVQSSMAAGAGLSVSQPAVNAPQTDPVRPRQHDEIWIDALGGVGIGQGGLDMIERSGLTMLETTLGPAGTPTFTYEAAVQDIARWHRNFDQHADKLIRVQRTADIMEAKRTGKLAVMIGFQNATHLSRDLRNVEFFYNLGIRQIQLTYNSLNALGAGCTERDDVGLSHFGVEVVQKMNELGMIVDLSHVGFKTTMDAVEVSEQPVLFTHSNCMALAKNARCKTDEEIKALARRGGVMGMTTVNFFVSNKDRSTADDYINHIAYAAELVGVDHVGIGSDSSIPGWRAAFPDAETFWAFHGQFKFRPEADVRWPPFIEALDVPEKMYIIAERLEKRAFSSADRKKIMGENVLRVYRQILG